MWNYELGEKSQFFEKRLQVNADVYYLRWSQVQSYVPLYVPEQCNMYFTDNGANATVKGAELRWRTPDYWTPADRERRLH